MEILNGIGNIARSSAQGIGSLFGMGQSPVKERNFAEEIGKEIADENAGQLQAQNPPPQNPNYIEPTAPIETRLTPPISDASQVTKGTENLSKPQGVFDNISRMGQEALNGNNPTNPADNKPEEYKRLERQFKQVMEELHAVKQAAKQREEQLQQSVPSSIQQMDNNFYMPFVSEYSPSFLRIQNPFLNGGMMGGMTGGMNGVGGWNPLPQMVNPTPIVDYFQNTFYPQIAMGMVAPSPFDFNRNQNWGFNSHENTGFNTMSGVSQDPMGFMNNFGMNSMFGISSMPSMMPYM